MNNKNITTSILQQAREYIEHNKLKIQNFDRPYFHMSSPIGWINDPNGFSLYNDEYHLFYQHHPYQTKWNNMYWGHCKTTDFIQWQYLPIALAPDEDYDSFGCFSGSAIEHENQHILMYTGVRVEVDEYSETHEYQTQCIAFGDGINYKKLDNNPVIENDVLPEGSHKNHFRDPKIWKEDGMFYAVVASKGKDGSGQIALFSSMDLKEWSFLNILASSNYRYGVMWECPDFFTLDNKYIMLLSPQEMLEKELEFHNGNSTIYMLGEYNKNNYSFKEEHVATIDYGLDFYAPQTLETEDGRRIMIAWMHSWDNYLYQDECKWAGMMTIPRELHIVNNKLYQQPIKEIENYYANQKIYNNVVCDRELELDDICGRAIDLDIKIDKGNYEYLSIEFAKNNLYKTTLTYNRKENILIFNRYLSGIRKDCIYERKINVKDQSGEINIRILLDKYSVEIFVNNGEQVMTSLIFTPIEAEQIDFISEGPVRFSVTKYDIVVE